MILGIGDRSVQNLADCYRKIWSTGAAGVTIVIHIQRDDPCTHRGAQLGCGEPHRPLAEHGDGVSQPDIGEPDSGERNLS